MPNSLLGLAGFLGVLQTLPGITGIEHVSAVFYGYDYEHFTNYAWGKH